MNSNPMSVVHQLSAVPWSWAVAASAQRLPAVPQARWLAVREGRVWLTRSRRQPAAAVDAEADLWLEAGQRQLLPPGTEWVLEGWPAAKLELLLAPPAPAARGALPWLRMVWCSVRAGLPWRPASAGAAPGA